MKNLRLVFEHKINDKVIPNGMPKIVVNDYIDYIEKNNADDYSYDYVQKFNNSFTYNFNPEFFQTWQFDNLNDLNGNGDILGSSGVNYLYYIGTNGNAYEGLNLKQIETHTSYFDNLSEKIKKYLNDKNNFYLFINQDQEGISSSIVEKIYLDCKKYNIDTKKIILASDTINFYELKNSIENKYNTKIDIKYFMNPWALSQASNMFRELESLNEVVSDLKKQRPYKFLCFNRKLKDDRILMISYLLGKNYNSSLLSFDVKYLENSLLIEDLINKNDTFSQIINKGFNKMKTLKKSVIDYDNLDIHNNLIADKKELYEQSYFSIVTETSTFSDQIRFTEKIFKPIINLHPFVIFGPPGILDILKYYGFKTFSDFWDESYDKETNRLFRFSMITNIIDELYTKSSDDWDEMTKQMKEILIHNRNILKKYFYELKKEEYEKNINLLIDGTFNNKINSILC